MLQSSPDFVGVDLATDAHIQLCPQAGFPEVSVKPPREFRFHKVTLQDAESFYLLLRLDYRSQLLLSLHSIKDIYALFEPTVFY
jgi:hypothetical protein